MPLSCDGCNGNCEFSSYFFFCVCLAVCVDLHMNEPVRKELKCECVEWETMRRRSAQQQKTARDKKMEMNGQVLAMSGCV